MSVARINIDKVANLNFKKQRKKTLNILNLMTLIVRQQCSNTSKNLQV